MHAALALLVHAAAAGMLEFDVTLADGERAVPAYVSFDTKVGLIVAVHTLPARTPGLSA